jgi:topoisomerase IA-like protein
VIVRQQEMLGRNKANYEKTLVKLYKLDQLTSERAKKLLEEVVGVGKLQQEKQTKKKKKKQLLKKQTKKKKSGAVVATKLYEVEYYI